MAEQGIKSGQMWPINGASRAKRLKWGAAQNQISWAYMKMLREGNKTMRVYDINPYIEVYRFYDNLYGLFNQNVDGAGDVWMWLVIGPEKAMLIDTACGLGDIKGLVDEITGGMPLIVVNTHGHPDHARGNCQFDKVHCYTSLAPVLEAQNEHMWDNLYDENGKNIWLEFDRKDLPTFRKYEIVGVPDGYTFNLGEDYEVELVFTGGHAAQHAMYLDKKGRYLFAGDDVCSDVTGCGNGGQFANLTTYRDCLTRLVARIDEFDYIFPMHFMVNLENHLLVNILETLNEAISDPDSYDYKIMHISGSGGPGRERMYKFIKGFSTIAYTENGIYPPIE
jgi:glyoxylase-like metal-dependent hydrolase (beta-lactamase superfamily II)